MTKSKKHIEDEKGARKNIIRAIAKLDYNISPSKIHRESGVSRKTVYKHLDRMRGEGLVYRSEITGNEKVKISFPLHPSPTLILSSFIDKNLKSFRSNGFLNMAGIHTVEMPCGYLKDETKTKIRNLIIQDLDGKEIPEDGEILISFFLNMKKKTDTLIISQNKMSDDDKKAFLEDIKKKQIRAGVVKQDYP